MSASEPQQSVAKYTRIIQLGKGGMASVFLAAMRAAHGATKLVVVKELLPDLALDPEFRTMFVDEARLATRLSHPNVVNTFEVLDDDGKCSIVMEYLEGQPLSRVRHALRENPLFLSLQIAVIVDVLNGLEYAHTLKDYDGTPLSIVHRDISPHNVFVNYTGDVKVVDFGIAKASDSVAETRIGVVKGKFGYMAPEQSKGSRIDCRADVFSVGVMLFEALVGARMWKGLNEAAIMHRLTAGDIPRPSSVKPVPPELEAVCNKALSAKPDDRYSSAAEFAKALEQAAKDLPSRRVISETVSAAFASERVKISRVLEEQLGSLKSTSSGGYAPPNAPPRVVTFPLGTLSEAQQPEVYVEPRSTGQTAASTAHSVQPPPMTPPRRWPMVAGGVVAMLALVGGTLFALRSPQPVASTAPTGETSVAASAPRTATPPSSKSTLTLRLFPSDAALSVDGSALPPGTTKLEGSRDSVPRVLHIEAPGYVSKDVPLSFVIDTTVEVALDRAPVVDTSTKPTARPPVTAAAKPPVLTAGKPPTATSKPAGKPTAKPGDPDIGY